MLAEPSNQRTPLLEGREEQENGERGLGILEPKGASGKGVAFPQALDGAFRSGS